MINPNVFLSSIIGYIKKEKNGGTIRLNKVKKNMGKIDKLVVTMTSNVKVKNDVSHHPLIEVLGSIKKGIGNLKSIVNEIKKQSDKDERNRLKMRCLPIFIPSGEFERVADDAVSSFNGVVCLDIDNLADFEKEKERLKGLPSVLSVMKSPSGNMKILVLTNLRNPAYYKPAYYKLGDEFGFTSRTDLKFDTSCCNISHPCFFSYDPTLYINNSVVPLPMNEDELKRTISPKRCSSTSLPKAHTILSKALKEPKDIKNAIVGEHTLFERFYSMTEGQRNTNLFILASFLKDAGVPEVYARDYLTLYYACDGFDAKEIASTISSAYK